MKKLLCLLSVLSITAVSLCSSAEAGIVGFQVRANGIFSPTNGVLVAVDPSSPTPLDGSGNVTAANGAGGIDILLNATNIDLDMNGTTNATESVSFLLNIDSPAGAVRLTNTAADNAGDDLSSGLVFSVSNVTGIDETGAAVNVQFDGFDQAILFDQSTGSTFTVNGTDFTHPGGANPGSGNNFIQPLGALFPTLDISVTALNNVDPGNVATRGGRLNFSIVPPAAIPEPSSLALLGLSAFGLIARRRRS